METRELWLSMSRGQESAPLSEKQKHYLISLARGEGIFNASEGAIRFEDGLQVTIKPATRATQAYGGFVGSAEVPGRWIATEWRFIQFSDTGYGQRVSRADLRYIDKSTNHKYTFVTPWKNSK